MADSNDRVKITEYNNTKRIDVKNKPARKGKVLIFDDDPDIVEVCILILEQYGYDVDARLHCNNLVNDINGYAPDVVIMDNRIPPGGGILATQIIKRTPSIQHIPVIFFSANNRVAQLAGEGGADACLEKPFNTEELSDLVEQLIAQHKNQQ